MNDKNIEWDVLSCCRVREVGEIMQPDDVILLCNKFIQIGFHTAYDHYFAGQVVTSEMDGKVICGIK